MICKLEIYNGELNIFPIVTNERVFAQITMGNIVKGQPGKSPIIGENDNWWIWDDAEGEYVDSGKVATTSSEVKAPTLVISTEKKLSSSSMTELSDYIKPEVQSGKIPIELFLNCIYCLNVEAGQTPIYTKPYTVLSNTFEQVAVIKVMVPDIVNKKFNEVTINIDQATRAITVSETVTLSDM